MATGASNDAVQTSELPAGTQHPETYDWQGSVLGTAYGRRAGSTPATGATSADDGFRLQGSVADVALNLHSGLPARQEIAIDGGNRHGSGILMVPSGYDSSKQYPLVVAIHNYNGSAADLANMIDAEHLRKEGNIVFLPDAADKSWMGNGIDYFGTKAGDNGKPVDDVAFIQSGIKAVEDRFNVDKNDITVATFSQGGALGWKLSSQMDRKPQELGRVRNFISAAGSDPDGRNGYTVDGLPGTNIVQYEPGYNGIQNIGNLLNGDPWVSDFLPRVVSAKEAVLKSSTSAHGVDQQIYESPDGSRVIFLYESSGEHAWPGQPPSYDSWIFGAGSISHVKLTDWVSQLSAAGRTPGDGR